MHPVIAVFSVVIAGYLAVCALFVAVGLSITHQFIAVTRWDNDVVRWFVGDRTGGLNHWASDSTKVADTLGILVVLLAATFVLLALRYFWDALLLALALMLELSAFLTVNSIVHRPRPSVPRLGSLPSTSSFPSGHTAAMVALYGGLAVILSARCRSQLVAVFSWMIAVASAAMIGVARVYSAMHHPTDVVAGALLGFAVLAVAVMAVHVGRRSAVERQRVRQHAGQLAQQDAALDPLEVS
jgi:membrane-associated phospholipid phosphatase